MTFSISPSENDTEEWKEAINDQLLEEGLETICAFLNSFGGKIIFGVNSEGIDVGLNSNIDEAQRKIYDLARNHLKPSAHPYFNVRVNDNKIFIFVSSNPKEIYQYKGKVWKRTGASNHCLTFEEATQLKNQRSNFTTEVYPGIFSRKTSGESWRCPNCGHLLITGNSSIVTSGGEPSNPKCPACGTPMQSNLLQ